MDAGSPAPGSSVETNGISDRRFAAQLESIQKVKQFLFSEKVLLQPDILESVDLGSLNNLKYAPNGRVPTEGEWKALDQKLASLTPLMTPALRWKFRISELQFFFITIPIVLMGTTVIATFSLALLMTFGERESNFLRGSLCDNIFGMDSFAGRFGCVCVLVRQCYRACVKREISI